MKNRVVRVFFIGLITLSVGLMAEPLEKMALINQAKKEVGEISPLL